MEATPAWIARLMPSAPWAWAMALRRATSMYSAAPASRNVVHETLGADEDEGGSGLFLAAGGRNTGEGKEDNPGTEGTASDNV